MPLFRRSSLTRTSAIRRSSLKTGFGPSATQLPRAATSLRPACQQAMSLLGETCGGSFPIPRRPPADWPGATAPAPEARPAAMLFAVHSYYALLLKLLAADVVASIHRLPPPSQMAQAATGANFGGTRGSRARPPAAAAERRGIFDGGLFTWYTSAWCEPVEQFAHDMAAASPGTTWTPRPDAGRGPRPLPRSIKGSLPRSLRRALGEFYTPPWLVAHVLDELG